MKRELTLIFSILSFWGTKLELKRVCSVRCGMKQTRNQRTTNSTRNEMEVQRTCSTSLRRNIGTVGCNRSCKKLQRSCKKAMYAVLGNRSVTEDVLSSTMCIAEQTLTKVSPDFNDLEALTLITFCLATRTFAYPIYQAQKNLLIFKNSFDKLKPMKISHGTDFVKNISQLWTSGKIGDLRWTKPLRKAISFGWSKTAISADITI